MSVIGDTTLRFTEEQAMLMDVARDFCRDRSPMSAVRALLESAAGFDPGVWDELVGLGWTGIALPEAVGGAGLGIGAMVPVVEAMGRAMLTTPLMSTALAGQLLLRAGGDGAQSEAWLARIAAGTAATVAWLESEDWGDDALGARLGADGVLEGRKRMVPDAAAAGLFVVPALRDGATVLAVVRADQLGQQARTPNTLIDLTRRACDVDFSGVRVESSAVIEGAAVDTALRDTRLLGALLVAAEAAGSTGACLDTVVEYLKTRKQFGRLIGSYQALKHPMVDILIELDAARSFVYHAASLVGEYSLDRDAEVACRMAKAQAAEVLSHAGDRAVQFHGGMGFTWECDAQLYIRRAQWSRQQFGDPGQHRRRLAALLLDTF